MTKRTAEAPRTQAENGMSGALAHLVEPMLAHMIPNAVLTRRRARNEGDFYACRKCNSAKSNIDYVLAVVAKAQSVDQELAARTLSEAILRDNNTSHRFRQMIRTAEPHADGLHMAIPKPIFRPCTQPSDRVHCWRRVPHILQGSRAPLPVPPLHGSYRTRTSSN